MDWKSGVARYAVDKDIAHNGGQSLRIEKVAPKIHFPSQGAIGVRMFATTPRNLTPGDPVQGNVLDGGASVGFTVKEMRRSQKT